MFSVLPASTASGQHHGYGALPSLALRRWFLNPVLCREGQLLTQEPFKLGGEIKQCLGKLTAKDFSLKAGVTARQEGNSLPFPSPPRPSVPYSSGPAICVLQVSSAITVFLEAEGGWGKESCGFTQASTRREIKPAFHCLLHCPEACDTGVWEHRECDLHTSPGECGVYICWVEQGQKKIIDS